MGGAPGADAQNTCMELARRMEEFEPVLGRAAGLRTAAGVTHTALQQGFVAYTYSYCEDPNVIHAHSSQFNAAVHVDQAKWAQAVQNNPDPRCCLPEPLVGLTALEQRIATQQGAMEKCASELEDLRTGYGNLKDQLQGPFQQALEECRRRHQKLSRQLLQVVTALETYAVLTGSARRSHNLEAQLEDRFARIGEAVHAPASARARVEELWVVLRGLLQRGPPAGVAMGFSEAEAGKTLQLTAAQGDLLEALQEELALRKRDAAQFESALARFATSAHV